MKAIIQVSEILTDTRWAKEIRVFGIPVYLARELNVKAEKEDNKRPIGFHQIGDCSLLQTDNEEEN